MEPSELPYADDEEVNLVTSDGEMFKTTVGIIKISETIKNLIADCSLETALTLPNVSSNVLSKILEYIQRYYENPPAPTEDAKRPEPAEWEKQFCSELEQPILFEIVLAANYLDIEPLLDVTCKTVAAKIKGKTTEEIRQTFNIVNDFTPEEEETIRKENEWCEERG